MTVDWTSEDADAPVTPAEQDQAAEQWQRVREALRGAKEGENRPIPGAIGSLPPADLSAGGSDELS